MKIHLSKEFIIYCLVGCVNTLVGISTAVIALDFFMMSYAFSTTLSYIVGTIVSFFLNKKYTFKNKDKSFIQFVKFFMTMLPSYIFSYWFGYKSAHFVSKYFVSQLNFLSDLIHFSTDKIVDNFALVISITMHLILGFSISKWFVFSKQKEH